MATLTVLMQELENFAKWYNELHPENKIPKDYFKPKEYNDTSTY